MKVKTSVVLVTFVFTEYVTLMNRAGWFGWMIFMAVIAVVITNVVATTVAGVAESAYSSAYQLTLSGEPSIAYVQVGPAPIAVVILSSAAPTAPPRSATFVDAADPVCAVDKFAVSGPWRLGVASTVAIVCLP
jgi:hypothetical protein